MIKHQWVYLVYFLFSKDPFCSGVVIKMKLKERTNNPPFCNYFYFFNLALFYSYIFPICGLFLDKTGAPTPNISVHYQLCTETTNLDYNCFILHFQYWVKFDYRSKIVSLTFLEWNFLRSAQWPGIERKVQVMYDLLFHVFQWD